MYVCVCMHACMYVCMYVLHNYVYMCESDVCTCAHMSRDVCTCGHMSLCVIGALSCLHSVNSYPWCCDGVIIAIHVAVL